MDQLLSLSPKQKKNVGKIFDHILERQYPGNITKITFEDVLLWDIWKSFMKIHGNVLLFLPLAFSGLVAQIGV